MANESTQVFETALEYEKSCQSRADLFYMNRYPGQTIFRPTWEEHRSIQQADIDVIMQSTAENGWPLELKISEKFRTQPWPDVCIEVFEDFRDRRPGWGIKTAAEWHAFFHEHKWTQTTKISLDPVKVEEVYHDDSFVRLVPTWAIRKMAAMCRDIFEETFKDMLENNVRSRDADVAGETVTLLMVPTKVNGKIAYWGACACIPLELFKTILNCEIEELKY